MRHAILEYFEIEDYSTTWKKMREWTENRTPDDPDQIWILQHPPVFTQGLAGKPEHVIAPGDIPVIQTDRGGQVTYHGPGQIVAYTLLDLERMQIHIRDLVSGLENAVIQLLSTYGIQAESQKEAPGVYVEGAKIASIGLRVKNGRSYHGLAFNVDMDLEPFSRINPCGFPYLKVTQLSHFVKNISLPKIVQEVANAIQSQFELH